jgi:uncharacterized Zn finger protein
MKKHPSFGEDGVRAMATAESFARGRDYLRRGTVSGLERRGNRLTAEVEGSEYTPYTVTIDLHESGVAATRCSCPYDWGGACKHVVAALLKYLEAPDAVVERPSLDDMLQGLDREALAALLVKRAETDLELATWLEAELSAGGSAGANGVIIDPEPIRRQATMLLSGRSSRGRGFSYGEGGVDEEALSGLIAKANPLLEAGDGHNALNILEPVMEALVPAWREQADWDETLHEFFPELGQMIAEAVLMSDLLPEECDDLMVRLDVWQGMLDEYGLDEHLQVAIDALEQGWDEIGLEEVLAGKGRTWPLSGTGDQRGWSDWTTVRLTQARLRVLEISGREQEYLNLASAAGRHGDHAAMLVRPGRLADAADYARKKFRSTDEVFEFARFLKANDEIDTALEIAEWGLTLSDDDEHAFKGNILARWLRDTAGVSGKNALALVAARAAFEQSHSLDDFEAAASLAGPEWSKLRFHLLASLAAAEYAFDRTEIYLREGMIEEAVRSVDLENLAGSQTNAVLMPLAEAAHASLPDWVIDIAECMASNIMEAGQSGSYEVAVQWLQTASLAYDAAGRFEEWIVKVDDLIERHRRKHKLRPLLATLRPRA